MSYRELDLYPHLAARRDLRSHIKTAWMFGIDVKTLQHVLREGFAYDGSAALAQNRFFVHKAMVGGFGSWFRKEATDQQIAKAVEIIWRNEKPYDLCQWPHESDREFVARVFSRTKQWEG